MKNQQGDSLTHRVRQNGPVFPPSTPIDTSLTPRRAATTSHFLEMGRAALDRQGDAPATPADIDAFLKDECAALVKFLEEAEARKDTEVVRVAKREEQKGETQRRREERRAASHAAHEATYKQLEDFTPTPDLPEALRACYAPKRLKIMAPAPPPPVADLVDLDALRPQRGKGAGTEGCGDWVQLLDYLARYVLTVRPDLYRNPDGSCPNQVVLHLANEMMAADLNKHVDTLRLWTPKLEAQGYIDARPHFSTMATRDGEEITVIDGTLYAIRLQPGHKALLSYDDLSQSYRNLDADRKAGRTAHNVIKRARKLAEQDAQRAEIENSVPDKEKNIRGSSSFSMRGRYLREQLKAWAVNPGQVQDPLFTDPRIFSPEEIEEAVKTVQDVLYLLPILAETHASKRAAMVGILGAALAHALDDEHSQRWYCKIIWAAWNAEVEGRGGLQVLAAQLARLDVDKHEWSSLKRPAALLNARLRAA